MMVSTTIQEVTKVTAGECLDNIQINIHTTEGTVAIFSSKQSLLKIADGIPEAIAKYEQELKKANEWGRNNALKEVGAEKNASCEAITKTHIPIIPQRRGKHE